MQAAAWTLTPACLAGSAAVPLPEWAASQEESLEVGTSASAPRTPQGPPVPIGAAQEPEVPVQAAAAADDPLAGAGQLARPAPSEPDGASAAAPDEVPKGPLRIERGEGRVPLILPRDERLLFRVELDLGWLGEPGVGRVELSSQVEPFRTSALVADEPGQELGERAVLTAHARGSYAVYELDEVITTLLLPQEWPAVIHRSVQSGTENRQRELFMGEKAGKGPTAWYRSDGHCKGCKDRAHYVEGTWAWQDARHCKRCKRGEHRVWREPRERPIPEGSLDMVSAVMLGRSMVDQGLKSTTFMLLDKLDLWNVTITRGQEKLIEVPAGKFVAVEVKLRTEVPPSEKNRDPEDFEGLFGIHGDISIWFEKESGVPILIRGKVPAGPINLDVRIALERARGTPPELKPLR